MNVASSYSNDVSSSWAMASIVSSLTIDLFI
nr:MAG TPA: hypothetical protein [Bacteriophage sp.]